VIFEKIAGLLLAAGKSNRMGRSKLHLPLEGKPLGSLALKTAITSKLDYTLVMMKEELGTAWIDTEMFNHVHQRRWSPIYCSDAERGQAHTIKCGIKVAQLMNVKAVIIILADQPFIEVGMLNHLIEEFQERMEMGQTVDFIASSYKGRIQPPMLMANTLFPALMELKGDQGARAILRDNSSLRGMCIEYDNWQLFHDVDTKEDYEKAKGLNRW